MGKKLTIKGHSTRGKEVIELLEMFGGVAAASKGFRESYCYYVSENFGPKYISWDYIGPDEINKYEIFTLEEFLEKYPFKVGDKVYIKVDPNANCLGSEKIYGEIESALWVEKFGHVVYKLKDCSGIFYKEELHPYEEEVSMEDNKVKGYCTKAPEKCNETKKIAWFKFWDNDFADKVELDLNDRELIQENGKWFVVKKKPIYPKTYAECCEVLVGRKPKPNEISFDKMELCLVDLDNTQSIDFQNPYLPQFNSLFRLRMCRDAYWKIYGEETGLGKPWKPDWTNLDQLKYCIMVDVGEFITTSKIRGQQILAFPTIELRDAFYENFKDLIEQCKELL